MRGSQPRFVIYVCLASEARFEVSSKSFICVHAPVAFLVPKPSGQDPAHRHLPPRPRGIVQVDASPPSTGAQHCDFLRQQRLPSPGSPDIIIAAVALPRRPRVVHYDGPVPDPPRRLDETRSRAADALGAPLARVAVQTEEPIHQQEGTSLSIGRCGCRWRWRDPGVLAAEDGEIGTQVRDRRHEGHAYVPGYGDLVEGRGEKGIWLVCTRLERPPRCVLHV